VIAAVAGALIAIRAFRPVRAEGPAEVAAEVPAEVLAEVLAEVPAEVRVPAGVSRG
jgi:hypothetical protein